MTDGLRSEIATQNVTFFTKLGLFDMSTKIYFVTQTRQVGWKQEKIKISACLSKETRKTAYKKS